MNVTENIITSLITLCGSGIGALLGIVINTKLSNYRIEQLEKKVDKHNNLIERVYKIESTIEVVEEQIKVINHRIEDLEDTKKECKK